MAVGNAVDELESAIQNLVNLSAKTANEEAYQAIADALVAATKNLAEAQKNQAMYVTNLTEAET